MNISIKEKSKTENTESLQLQKGDSEILINTNSSFADLLNGKINENNISVGNIDKLPDIDFNYDSISMDLTDAMFFINLTQEGQFSVQSAQNSDFPMLIKTEIAQNTITQKTVEVTNQLTSLIDKAQKTQKPVRISFDNNISVILKIDKHGKVSAEFIPGSIEAENYLMTNISSLKQKFDEQNLPYSNLSYRQNGRHGRNKNKNKGDE